MKLLPALFLFIFCCSNAANALDATEMRIARSVDTNLQEALLLLEKAVNINSGTMNFPGVKKVGDLFSTELASLGFTAKWVDGKPFARAGHLVARRGSNGPRIMLIGHLDTVFEPGSPFQKFDRIDQRYARGPGVTDMKGGDVVMLYALRALQDAGVLDRVQLRIVMTGDEEHRGQPYDLSCKDLVETGIWADFAIGFEDGDGDPGTAVVSRRGASNWQLQVSGKPAHSSQIFREDIGYGAIYESARILNEFRTALSTVPNLTFNPGMIAGGTDVQYDAAGSSGAAFGKNNVIAESATVSGDIRALSPQQLKTAKDKMQSIVADSLAHTSASLVFESGYPPMAPSPGNSEMLRLYTQVSEDLGYGPVKAVDPRRAGAADISFVAEHVSMAIDGLGLMGKDGHTVDETADLDTLSRQIKRAALLIYRLK